MYLPAAVTLVAVAVSAAVSGCSPTTRTAELNVGDCLQLGGTADQPTGATAACGSSASNFKVVVTLAGEPGGERCPADVDSSYSMHTAFDKSGNTACLDIDWVVGGCMSVNPEHNANPLRVDCNDASVPHRQRATQIITDATNADQCASGLGYSYDERRFTVCVEDVS